MLNIGLTGSIGSGKSTVANIFASLGITVIDADKCVHELLTEKDIISQVVSIFDGTILSNNGIDRARLRHLVFSQPEKKQQLEDLLHPLVRERMRTQANSANSPYVVHEIPLLIETLPNPLIDRILLITTTEALQFERIKARSKLSDDAIKQIVSQQLPNDIKIKHSDDIITNDGSIETLTEAVRSIHETYLDLAKDTSVR